MPTYTIEHEKTGEVRELYRSIAKRDNVPSGFKRIIGAPLVKPTGGRIDPTDADVAVPRAFKELTNAQSENFLKTSGFNREHIRKTWGV